MGAEHIAHYFVPARFICLLLHLFGLFTLITPNGKRNSIEATIYPPKFDPDNTEYLKQFNAASNAFDSALAWAITFCLFELLSMTAGFVSISSPLLSCFSVVVHGLGTLLLFFTVFDGWAYTAFNNFIFWITSFLPFIIEVLLDCIIFRDNVRRLIIKCYDLCAPLVKKAFPKRD